MREPSKYLKKHTEALVKDVGIENACTLSGRSKTSLNSHYSDTPEHIDRFMPIDAVAALEATASYPYVTISLAELNGRSVNLGGCRRQLDGELNSDVIELSKSFARLLSEYQISIQDGVISATEAKRMVAEILILQSVLINIKIHLGNETITRAVD